MPDENAFGVAQNLLRERKVWAALGAFDFAEKLGYPQHECCAGRWQCWMLLGEFERAWQESDLISASGVNDPHRYWDGSSWVNKRIMLRCLHGLGDTINFIRYAPLLKATCRELIVQAHPELVTLLEKIPFLDQVVTWSPGGEDDGVPWDVQMEVNELPRVFRTVLETIPATFPYLFIPEERLIWASRLLQLDGRPLIGLCWRAGPWDASRSLEVADIAPLLSVSEITFVSLQKAIEPPFRQIVDAAVHAADVLDTAAVIAHLDMVITVDTMVAHLAGALGKPVWLLLPKAADWRWMMDTAKSPWYPTARLFRQDNEQGWSKPINELIAELLTLQRL
jgi:hypothetical protein